MRRFLVLAVAVGVVAVVPVASAKRSGPAVAKATSSFLPAGVTAAGDNWLFGEGDQSNSRYSTLSQINSSNVANLKNVWNDQFNPTDDLFTPETMPICCANGNMYLTYINGVVAVNPGTGATVWTYQGPAHPTLPGQRTYVDDSRDTAYNPTLNYIYSGQQDGSIVALNAKTGTPVWTVQVTGAGTYGGATGAESAPFTQYVPEPGGDGLVLSAPNGGESPFRGHLDAYDAKTGALIWRSWNLPDPTQIPYILSWGNPAEAATGGAATWSIPSADPQLGDVYYGTGNPFPETGRQPGDDLWTETILAVNWKTGALRWYFQATRHDEFDYDLPHPTERFNVPIGGKMVPILAEGSKGGYFFALNARNGGVVPGFQITQVPTYDPTGGKGIAENAMSASQPVPSGASHCMVIVDYSTAGLAQCGFPANTLATEYGGTNNVNVQANGSLVNAANGIPIVGTTQSAAFTNAAYFTYGGAGGGGNFGYPPSSFDPQTNTLYACVQNESGAHTNQGTSYNQASVSASATQGIVGFYSAINMTDNKMLWQYQSQATGLGVCYSGSLSTAGDLAFTAFKGRSDQAAANADQGNTQQGAGTDATPGGSFVAFDAKTGNILWSWNQPHYTYQAPAITYMYNGKQYVAIYHGVGAPGDTGATSTGQRDQLSVFSL